MTQKAPRSLNAILSIHMPFYDRLFGTYHMPDEHWPSHYGTSKRLPRTWLSQLLYPFRSG